MQSYRHFHSIGSCFHSIRWYFHSIGSYFHSIGSYFHSIGSYLSSIRSYFNYFVGICYKGKPLPRYNKIYGWNIRLRNCILGHKSVQRREIQQWLHPRCANALQTNRDLSIHEFLLVSSTSVKKGFIKGEALRILRANSSHSTFNKNMQSFKTRLKNRGYPNEFLEKPFFEDNFKDRSLENKDKSTKKKMLPFVTQYHPALPSVKNITYGEIGPYSKSTVPKRNIISQRKFVKRHLGKR